MIYWFVGQWSRDFTRDIKNLVVLSFYQVVQCGFKVFYNNLVMLNKLASQLQAHCLD